MWKQLRKGFCAFEVMMQAKNAVGNKYWPNSKSKKMLFICKHILYPRKKIFLTALAVQGFSGIVYKLLPIPGSKHHKLSFQLDFLVTMVVPFVTPVSIDIMSNHSPEHIKKIFQKFIYFVCGSSVENFCPHHLRAVLKQELLIKYNSVMSIFC